MHPTFWRRAWPLPLTLYGLVLLVALISPLALILLLISPLIFTFLFPPLLPSVATGTIAGFGVDSYRLALRAVAGILAG